eukprot:TRINITY_DN78968_c0_g1_i1.p1 TRINITY_DN78968_c0_g1~~TRINITY_DN78968_c0_g1_i1.p1  ORF type:complete len:526 (-),score=105.98 TRINITY_DN78968_c0_g1_i1:147-1724(-)
MGKICSTLTGRGKLEDLAPLINQVSNALEAAGAWGSCGSRDLVTPVKLTGRRRSVFIGCNYIGTQNELHGCINDVKRMMPVVETLGFPTDEGHRRVLLDEPSWPEDRRPTKANIIEALKWLVEGVQTGDALFLHYSGHGGREPSKDPNDDSPFHESLVPLDFETAGMLLDTELFDLLVRPLPSGSRLTCVLDSCHSAGALDLPYLFVGTPEELKKGLAGEAIQMVMSKKWSDDMAKLGEGDPSALMKDVTSMGLGLWNLKSQLDAAAGADGTGYLKDQTNNIGTAVGEVLALTGCRSDQTSADVGDVSQFHLESLSDGRQILIDRHKEQGTKGASSAGGALTSAFLEAMLEQGQSTTPPGQSTAPTAQAPLTYFSLLEKIRKKLAAGGYSQVPQVASSLLVDLKQHFALDTVFVPAPPPHAAAALGPSSTSEANGSQQPSQPSLQNFLAALAAPGSQAEASSAQQETGNQVAQQAAPASGSTAPQGISDLATSFLTSLAQHPEGLSMLQQHSASQPQQAAPATAV